MRLIAVLLILVMSVSGGVFVWFTLNKKAEPETEVRIVEVPVPKVEEEVHTVDVMVARTRIPVGSILAPELVDYKPWPQNLVLPDFIKTDGKGDAEIMGHVARSEFSVGEPIIVSKLANPEDPNFLAGALGKGMRAITISVDSISGVAGFIFPGDHVDILTTHSVSYGAPLQESTPAPRPGMSGGGKPVAEILVPDVKVIAVDQRAAISGNAEPKPASTLTLEVTPRDAERIRLAERNGSYLSLMLRSLKQLAEEEGEEEKEPEKLVSPVTIEDLSRITPPSYFPILYDFNTDGSPEAELMDMATEPMMMMEPSRNPKSDVTIVRGSTAQTIGITRP